MSTTSIKPTVAHPSAYYGETLSWKISEESWNQAGALRLDLHAAIPRAMTRISTGKPRMCKHGGALALYPATPPGFRRISFLSAWPVEVEAENVRIEIVLEISRQWKKYNNQDIYSNVKLSF